MDDSDSDERPISFKRASNGTAKESATSKPALATKPSSLADENVKLATTQLKSTTVATGAVLVESKPIVEKSNGPIIAASGKKRPPPADQTIQDGAAHKKPKQEDLLAVKVAQQSLRVVGETEKNLKEEDNQEEEQETENYNEDEDEDEDEDEEDEDEGDEEYDEDDDEDLPLAKKAKVLSKTQTTIQRTKTSSTTSKNGMQTKKEVEVKVKKKVVDKGPKKKNSNEAPGSGGGKKWTTLEHNGVIFPPAYQAHGVKMLYDGSPVDLTPAQEEVATMFAVMKDTDYATKSVFIKNFWDDWRKILGPKHKIQKLDKCDFTPIYEWHLAEKEKKKLMTTEEKKAQKEEKMALEDKYMWAVVDGVKEKVGNFRVEPPGLFRGRGEHPKMGKLKSRIVPEDITINIGKGAPVPPCPIPGHRWKEVRHDNTVTWLAFWNDPINNKEFKYVFLSAASNLKGQSDKQKYEKARKLKDYIDDIRKTYTRDFQSKELQKRQTAVATYLIDRLALRAGNEKDEDEADTVGCCSLKVEHVALKPPKSLEFDFLGKDSIRYFNTVEVEPMVYKAIGDFQRGKKKDDDIFDKLDTTKLNTHLKEIMPSLTAKVFRTYNASITLDTLLQDTVGTTVQEKVADYQRANKEVAILCNHQRTVSKAHAGQMEKLEVKMAELQTLLEELEVDLDRAKKGKPPLKQGKDGSAKKAQSTESLEKKVAQTKARLEKMTLDMRVKDDLKTVALGTSKINYLDPRISVAWCKKHDVPIEKIFNKSLLAKFSWAMDVPPDYRF